MGRGAWAAARDLYAEALRRAYALVPAARGRRGGRAPLTAWCRTVYAGVLVGTGARAEAEAGTETDRLGEAYRPNLARLREIKRRFDPGNLVRRNANVAPAIVDG